VSWSAHRGGPESTPGGGGAGWYHDFGALGLATQPARRAGWRLLAALRATLPAPLWRAAPRALHRLGLGPAPHLLNQREKEAVLLPWLRDAVAASSPACLDLFCADGYYSCWISKLAPSATVLGIDRAAEQIALARRAAQSLDLGRVEFRTADVRREVPDLAARFDLILCSGGLYHLERPADLLKLLAPRLSLDGTLIVQSAVSLAIEREDYFESPAPGWRGGCRFSHGRLGRWLRDAGYRILDERRGELPGNRRLADRGSSYFLCRGAIT